MKTKQNILSSLPPSYGKARIEKLLVKARLSLEKSQKILLQFPSNRLIYILKLREAFLSLYTQGMDIDLEAVCELKIKNKSSSVFIKRINNYLKAIEQIEKINEKTVFDAHFWEKLHSLVEKDFDKIKQDVGQIRERQNWIGPKDCSIEEAFFLPPPHSKVPALLHELSSYINTQEEPLLQIGISFAHFLGIHPFMDGNGRVARLIPAALLKKKNCLSSAILYLSEYFLFHRIEYLKELHHLTMKKNWNKWLSFYAKAICQESRKLSIRLAKLSSLYLALDKTLSDDLTPSQRKKIIIFLFEHPVFTTAFLKKKVLISPALIKKAVSALVKNKAVAKKKNSLFVVTPLFKIAFKKKKPGF